MKQLSTALIVCALAVAGAAVAQKGGTGGSTGTSSPQTSSSSPTGQAGMDADAVAQLCQINENEIVAASVAEAKKVSGPVADFAQTLRKAHAQNLVDTLQVASKAKMTMADSPAAMELHKKAAAELNTLTAMDGDKFQKGFLDMMVKGHTEAVQKLDGFIAQTKNAELKKHLQTTRSSVQQHLDQAKKLQGGNTAQGG